MKTAAKIIAYLVWFVFSLGLSALFFLLVVRIEDRIGIFFEMRIWLLLGSWFGFVALMAWVPVWLIKKRSSDSARLIAKAASFLVALLFCAVVCTILWDNFVVGKLFNCTDSLPFNFLNPGDWVHGHYVTVPQINPNDPMDKPDSIKEGWTIPKLWFLWSSFVAAAVAVSTSLTILIFRQRNRKGAQAVSP